jgi:hypothetical protein
MLINNYKYISKNFWLINLLKIKVIFSFTHTDKILLETLSKEIITMSQVTKLDSSIQSLYHIHTHGSNRLSPEENHIVRTWSTSLPPDQSINVNKGILSVVSDKFPIYIPKVRGALFPYNSTKFSEEILQGSRLNKCLGGTSVYVSLNQDQKLDLNKAMFFLAERNFYNPDFLLLETIGLDYKTTFRIPPRLHSGELLESFRVRSQFFAQDKVFNLYEDHLYELMLLNRKKTELEGLLYKIKEIIDLNLDINEKMKEITKECLLFDSILTAKEKSIGVGVLLPPLTSEEGIKELSNDIENSGKLIKLFEQSEEAFEKLSFEDKQRIMFIIGKCVQTNLIIF